MASTLCIMAPSPGLIVISYAFPGSPSSTTRPLSARVAKAEKKTQKYIRTRVDSFIDFAEDVRFLLLGGLEFVPLEVGHVDDAEAHARENFSLQFRVRRVFVGIHVKMTRPVHLDGHGFLRHVDVRLHLEDRVLDLPDQRLLLLKFGTRTSLIFR